MIIKLKKLYLLFWVFFKLSPITFGGGYAMIPVIEKEIVEKRKWLLSKDLTDILAIAQTIPGSIAINAATFVGFRMNGILGAVAAILGVSLPTFFIILFLGTIYLYLRSNQLVQGAFIGISAAIVSLIVYAAIKVWKTSITDKTTFFILLVGLPVLFFIHPVITLFLAATAGTVISIIKQKIMRKKQPLYNETGS